MDMFNKAYEIARKAHEGQVDKAGEPYFNHVSRIAHEFYLDTDVAIVALLHDVVEDTGITLDDLRSEGFNNEIIKSIDAITKRKDEKYSDYLERVVVNPMSRSVKAEALRHNMDLSRLPSINDKDIERIRKYHAAYVYLKGGL